MKPQAMSGLVLQAERTARGNLLKRFHTILFRSLNEDFRNPELANIYAEKRLRYNTESYTNARGNGKNASTESVTIDKVYHGLKDRSFFFCCFPLNFHGDEGEEDYTIKEEMCIRNFQFLNFISFADGYDPDEKVHKNMKHFVRYIDFKQSVNHFIKTVAVESKVSFLIFDGHGDEKGFQLEEEPASIPWNMVIRDIEAAILDTIKRSKNTLKHVPEIVLVFAQCYAHCRTIKDSSIDFVTLISFTNDSSKQACKTRQEVHRNIKTGGIVDSHHFELDKYGVKLKYEKHNRRSRSRHNSGGDILRSSKYRLKEDSSFINQPPPLMDSMTCQKEIDSHSKKRSDATQIRMGREGKLRKPNGQKRKKFKTNPPQDCTSTEREEGSKKVNLEYEKFLTPNDDISLTINFTQSGSIKQNEKSHVILVSSSKKRKRYWPRRRGKRKRKITKQVNTYVDVLYAWFTWVSCVLSDLFSRGSLYNCVHLFIKTFTLSIASYVNELIILCNWVKTNRKGKLRKRKGRRRPNRMNFKINPPQKYTSTEFEKYDETVILDHSGTESSIILNEKQAKPIKLLGLIRVYPEVSSVKKSNPYWRRRRGRRIQKISNDGYLNYVDLLIKRIIHDLVFYITERTTLFRLCFFIYVVAIICREVSITCN